MTTHEFLKLSPQELNDLIKRNVPNIEVLKEHSLFELLEIPGFKSFRPYINGEFKPPKIYKKHNEGLGHIMITHRDFDLEFYSIQGNSIGRLWRYPDGSCKLVLKTIKMEISIEVGSVSEMLKLYYDTYQVL